MKSILSAVFLLTFILLSSPNKAQNANVTRLMHSPAISENNIAFIYAEDLWIADLDGQNPRRLTIDEGVESNPVFSPDGKYIAFSAEYDGNTDVFIIPSTGGIPQRLTWHPSADMVRDFTPNGDSVLFNSQRNVFTRRYAKLYKVSIKGGNPTELPIPTAFSSSYSPDGNYIVYAPNMEVFHQWKNYRGGTQSKLWIYNVNTHDVEVIQKPEGGCNDYSPKWVLNDIYFLSDRNGEFNIYSYNTTNKKITQHTFFDDFPVENIACSKNKVLFEQAGSFHVFDRIGEASRDLPISIATDLLELRPRYVSGNKYIRSADVSPSGVRAVFDFRGDIVTLPADKGDMENLTQTSGVHEQSPAWSPDGKTIAYFSDETGEYALHLKNMDSKSVKKIKLEGTGFYGNIHWAPNSEKLCYVDNGRNFYLYDIKSSLTTIIATNPIYMGGPYLDLFCSWSPDSKWLSYYKFIETSFQKAFVYSLDENKSYALSDGLSSVSEVVFDPSGKYLYMLASTDAGPVLNWFDQSSIDMEMTNSIYLVTLQKDTKSPLAKENDQEIEAEKKEEDEKDNKEVHVSIDWDNFDQRIISLPVKPAGYYNLTSPEEGKIIYLKEKKDKEGGAPDQLMMYTLKDKEEKEIMEANYYKLTSNNKKLLFKNKDNWGIAEVGKKPEKDNLKTEQIEIKIDPTQEWSNIFNEAWRVNRDYFYDPGMHGCDWDAMKQKYSVFLNDISCRSDLYRVMQWMFSELAVGHHRFSNRGDKYQNPPKIKGGLLGADYQVVNNRFQIEKIYGGLNWNPGLRSPLTEPGIDIKEGDFIIAINGKEVYANENFYSFFENTADKIIKLKVSSSVDGSEARVFDVVPLNNENDLRNRDWVESNLKKVNEATNGQVAYVYVPNTTVAGHEYFKRYFFPQVDKKAIIIDERYNGGGQLADYYIDILKRPYQSSWNYRYGKDVKAPNASIQGPKVMLINEGAGSGGDYLPWMFRKFGMGTIIGTRTWGGLVGITGYPQFIDGGAVTAPNLAFWTEEEGFGVENAGVAPDIEVEQWPKQIIEGRDPQLEKAIEVILKQLEDNPPKEPVRPEYPIRVRK
ncbi:S41 family peptidase [Plebeiibacterium sediminum]|uniref:Tricorn protease homolog n=1 Tax=Plebeiibacterium sediminum TaxID=2992112 RepID=A0AAE3M825_9BACT|nr:S41 family peptidase [Plebeiobacterium sediminum]MCW3788706.1 PDZ domain-containing protein [Plebeiobacterium sediminum]